MLDSTELDDDLLYLKDRYGISSAIIDGLRDSPTSALMQIRLYKMKMLSICMLFATLGGAYIAIALLYQDQWIGLLSGMIGSVIIVYAFSIFRKIKTAIFDIEMITKYHELL